MKKEEMLHFCNVYAISIRKFIRENYSLMENISENEMAGKGKLKHIYLKELPCVVGVPLPFAIRNKELVANGTLLIVKDDYKINRAYLNPRILTVDYELGGSADVERLIYGLHGEEALEEGNRIQELIDYTHCERLLKTKTRRKL